jgi:hypothetical protein
VQFFLVFLIMARNTRNNCTNERPVLCDVPFVAPTKKNTSLQLTASPELCHVIMDNHSGTSSLPYSSDSENEAGYKFADFIPMSLPPGRGIVSSELQVSFREMLDVMAKLDFSSLTHEKSIEWNIALSKTCLCFSKEMS